MRLDFMRNRALPALFAAFTVHAAGAAASDMVQVPAGPLRMGRDDGPPDERPAHRVEVAAFEINRTEVTNEQFAAFLNAQGDTNAAGERLYDADDPDARIHRAGTLWRADDGYDRHPAVEVTWAGARDYCRWRGQRLPTEAEWEKAARGGDERRYPWGASPPDSTRGRFAAAFNATVPVGMFPAGASPHGALDMAGNVWEWVASAYRPYPYRADDGRENANAGPVRATRGGGHDSPAGELTTTQRGLALSRNPRAGHHNIGFRCVR